MAAAAQSRRRPAEVLAPEEVRALITACSNRAPTGIRNRALLTVLWRCGLRVGEALALEPKDIDVEAHTLRVRHGKGDKSRTVGLDDQTQALISRWVDRRHQLGVNGRRKLPAPSTATSSTSPTCDTSCAASRPRPGSTSASIPTGCGTPTPRSWRWKACP